MKNIKIILVDDNSGFRECLKTLLVHEHNVTIIGEASNAEEFWKIDKYWLADIILMDIMMPNGNGIDLTKKIRWQYLHLKIIAITMHIDKVYLTSLIQAGFFGCIFKDNLFNTIDKTFHKVLDGHLCFPNNMQLGTTAV